MCNCVEGVFDGPQRENMEYKVLVVGGCGCGGGG